MYPWAYDRTVAVKGVVQSSRRSVTERKCHWKYYGNMNLNSESQLKPWIDIKATIFFVYFKGFSA